MSDKNTVLLVEIAEAQINDMLDKYKDSITSELSDKFDGLHDDVDHKILDLLIDNSRIPFTDIAKKLLISAGTVHVRVKKMEDAGIIKGSSLALDYKKLGYTFIAYIGIFLEKTHLTNVVLEKLDSIPFVTVAHITTGRFNIFCKVRSRNTNHAKEIIFMIDDIDGVSRTETMISLEESINDKKRLMHKIFNEIK